MSRRVRLIFDCPGPWDSTWIKEVKNGKVVMTQIQKGDVVEADLEDGSLRSEQLKYHISVKTCRIEAAKSTKPSA